MIITGLYGERIVDIRFAGQCLRVFLKPWTWPYAKAYINMRLFGAGPVGFMWWGK